MSTLGAPPVRMDPDPAAIDVSVGNDMLQITSSDGRELAAPLAWFPRLRDATPEQQRRWELIGRSHGIHWPDVDEDVSVRALMGRPT